MSELGVNAPLTQLNVAGMESLQTLEVANLEMTTIDLTGCSNLDTFISVGSTLLSMDFRDTSLAQIWLEDNPELKILLLKNGVTNTSISNDGSALDYICVDEGETIHWVSSTFSNVEINSYCSFTPGGEHYTIQTTQTLDLDGNGCGSGDGIYPNLPINVTTEQEAFSVISDLSGTADIYLSNGSATLTPIVENPEYFQVIPDSVTIESPASTNFVEQSFCITPIGAAHDLEIVVSPLAVARPGFDAKYLITYKNKGSVVQSGGINLTFEDSILDFVSSDTAVQTQSLNNLTWSFSTLQPLEYRNIIVVFNVNSPVETPSVNIGDILLFNASVFSAATDLAPEDNSSLLSQIVVGSYDPNDKRCIQGHVVSPQIIILSYGLRTPALILPKMSS